MLTMGEAVCWAGGMREISVPSTQSAVNLTDKVYFKKKTKLSISKFQNLKSDLLSQGFPGRKRDQEAQNENH